MRNITGLVRCGYRYLPVLGIIVLGLSLTASATIVFESGRDYVIEPEYERTLQQVLLSCETSTEDLSHHRSVIENLPGYTKIIMLVPKNRADAIRLELKGMGVTRNVKLVPFQTRPMKMNDAFVLSTGEQRVKRLRRRVPMPRGTIWAQDLCEVATDPEGSSVILTPFIHKIFLQKDGDRNSKVFQDNQFLSNLRGEDISTRDLPLVFKGGNVLIDKHRGTRLAFVGGDVIRNTIMVMNQAMDQNITEGEVISRLRRHLNVERVIVIGLDDHQPLKMFHLDQAMVLLGSGVAGVTRVVGHNGAIDDHDLDDVISFLDELRSTLKELDYRIVDMDITAGDVLKYRYYVNGIPYINRLTKKKEFLLPMFGSSLSGPNYAIYMDNIRRLEELGYKVLPVYTESNERHGGLHCLVNVLS